MTAPFPPHRAQAKSSSWVHWKSPWSPIRWMCVAHAGAVIVLIGIAVIGADQRKGTIGASVAVTVAAIWMLAGVFVAPTITALAIVFHVRLRKRDREKNAATTGARVAEILSIRELQCSAEVSDDHHQFTDKLAWRPEPVILPAAVEAVPVARPSEVSRPVQIPDRFETAVPAPEDFLPGLSFVALDFETANAQRGSTCAVGMAVVLDGRVIAAHHHLVRPSATLRSFKNTRIHGISEADVRTAPEWPAVREGLLSRIRGLPIVAYSTFDKSVWHSTNQVYGLVDEFAYFDVLRIARNSLTLDNYKLSTVVEHLGLGPFEHHDPKEDAEMAARVIIALARRAGAASLAVLYEPVSQTSSATSRRPGITLPEPNTAADPSNPLFGQRVCFTGDLQTNTRAQAQKLAADLGATVSGGVTRKTTLVVVGEFDPSTLRHGEAVSTKVRRAMELADAGQSISVINESEFLRLLGQS
jgi:DNA polymerase-3 subunit epsilon